MAQVHVGCVKRRSGERRGVLLLRAWVEGEPPLGLRVRIIRLHGEGEPSSTVTSTVDATCALVQSWLNELLKTSPPPKPPSRDA